MTPAIALTALLALAVVAAMARLAWRWSRAPAATRAAPWRLATLLALQPLGALLLYRMLAPSPPPTAATLVVATRHADRLALLAAAGPVVALPEADVPAGVDRVPDLATALRSVRPARLRIVGDGLEPRDRDAARGLPVDFAPSAAPAGLIGVDPPAAIAAGDTFRVGGAVAGVARATVDLIDPAGRRVATATPDKAGAFVVGGTARAAGPATFTLRVRDGARLVETAEVPVWTAPALARRVLILAGAPGPETKFLRRWANDAGLAAHSRVATGAGVTLGDAPVALTAAALGQFDVVVVDERSWAALGPGDRATVVAAVRGGLGLIARIGGPLDDRARTALRSLGFALAGGDDTAPVVLARVDGEMPADPAAVDAPPPLSRWAVKVAAPLATPLLRDARGTAIASWRPEGDGRIALWPLADSYRLVLAGDGATYGQLWSHALATVGRGAHRRTPVIGRDARVDQRVTVCGVDGAATVVAPDGKRTRLLVDPAAGGGCAGFWPARAGWHRVEPAAGDDGGTPFFVAAADALPNVRAEANRDATRQLAADAPPPPTGALPAGRAAGGPWRWALAWLLVAATTWWFERSRLGVAGTRATRPTDRRALA